MKYIITILLVFTMLFTGCKFKEKSNIEKIPADENRVEETDDFVVSDGEMGGIVNGGNISYVDKPDKEIEQPEVVFAVLDKIDYRKPIIGYTYTFNGELVVDTENAGAYGDHVICVPYIAGLETEEIINLNQKIYSEVEPYYNILLNNEEDVNTYNVKYYATVVNPQAISIILEISIGEQMVGGTTFYKTFYFDCEKRIEITFDEYIEKMGYTKESFNSMLLTLKSKYFAITEKEAQNVIGVAISDEKIHLVIENPDAVDAEPAFGLWTFDR